MLENNFFLKPNSEDFSALKMEESCELGSFHLGGRPGLFSGAKCPTYKSIYPSLPL